MLRNSSADLGVRTHVLEDLAGVLFSFLRGVGVLEASLVTAERERVVVNKDWYVIEAKWLTQSRCQCSC